MNPKPSLSFIRRPSSAEITGTLREPSPGGGGAEPWQVRDSPGAQSLNIEGAVSPTVLGVAMYLSWDCVMKTKTKLSLEW